MVIPEALSYGLPILCYDNYGPGELANTLYVLPDHIELCFDDGGRQLAPVSLFIREGKYKELPALINDTGLFYAEVKETCEETRQAHIQLHPGAG